MVLVFCGVMSHRNYLWGGERRSRPQEDPPAPAGRRSSCYGCLVAPSSLATFRFYHHAITYSPSDCPRRHAADTMDSR
jgi:hypothetical protein